ncbi:hypothetical protein BDW22DRAFT_1220410 [Trametopsis cervina]|nr:hypothetical protein BDW22DRAFT_1220410 [Trametopsis cervina]
MVSGIYLDAGMLYGCRCVRRRTTPRGKLKHDACWTAKMAGYVPGSDITVEARQLQSQLQYNPIVLRLKDSSLQVSKRPWSPSIQYAVAWRHTRDAMRTLGGTQRQCEVCRDLDKITKYKNCPRAAQGRAKRGRRDQLAMFVRRNGVLECLFRGRGRAGWSRRPLFHAHSWTFAVHIELCTRGSSIHMHIHMHALA